VICITNYIIDTNIIVDYLFLKNTKSIDGINKQSINSYKLLALLLNKYEKIPKDNVFFTTRVCLAESIESKKDDIIKDILFKQRIPFQYFYKYKNNHAYTPKNKAEIINSINIFEKDFVKVVNIVEDSMQKSGVKNLFKQKEIMDLMIDYNLSFADAMIFSLSLFLIEPTIITNDQDFTKKKMKRKIFENLKIKIINSTTALNEIEKLIK